MYGCKEAIVIRKRNGRTRAFIGDFAVEVVVDFFPTNGADVETVSAKTWLFNTNLGATALSSIKVNGQQCGYKGDIRERNTKLDPVRGGRCQASGMWPWLSTAPATITTCTDTQHETIIDAVVVCCILPNTFPSNYWFCFRVGVAIVTASFVDMDARPPRWISSEIIVIDTNTHDHCYHSISRTQRRQRHRSC